MSVSINYSAWIKLKGKLSSTLLLTFLRIIRSKGTFISMYVQIQIHTLIYIHIYSHTNTHTHISNRPKQKEQHNEPLGPHYSTSNNYPLTVSTICHSSPHLELLKSTQKSQYASLKHSLFSLTLPQNIIIPLKNIHVLIW